MKRSNGLGQSQTIQKTLKIGGWSPWISVNYLGGLTNSQRFRPRPTATKTTRSGPTTSCDGTHGDSADCCWSSCCSADGSIGAWGCSPTSCYFGWVSCRWRTICCCCCCCSGYCCSWGRPACHCRRFCLREREKFKKLNKSSPQLLTI